MAIGVPSLSGWPSYYFSRPKVQERRMAPALTIRNLSSTPIELKLVERYEAAQPSNGGDVMTNLSNVRDFTSLSNSFTNLMSNVTSAVAPGPTSAQLAENAQSFSHQDVSIRVEPYEAKQTDIAVQERGPNEILRLTFENDGQRYRIDAPTPSSRSTVLTPLSQNPKYEYTGVFLPEHSYLAIFSSANLNSWMNKLKNHSPLSALSIPGTHNSPTHHKALPSVRCQAVTVREQLDNGVRFMDIRVQPEDPEDLSKDGLVLVHSAFPVSLTGNKYFRDLLNTVTEFLDRNPSETIVISLKREGVGKATDEHLSKILHRHYTNNGRWFTENRIPTLGEVRNKIVLVRRFNLDDSVKGEHNGQGIGLDASSWPDNCEDGLCSSGTIRVQDFYEVEESINIDKKIRFSHAHLDRAGSCTCPLPADMNIASTNPPNPFYINFLSASNFFRPGCWPDRVAAKVNPAMVDFLCRRHNEAEGIGMLNEAAKEIGDGSTGIVVCDWVGDRGDWDLVRCIVGHNAKLEMKQHH
jgi:1-phosphatidylinositol phosphodiesterase